jgi:hypothetical protein
MDREKILQELQDDLAAAKTRRDLAARLVGRAVHEVTPDAIDRVRQASCEYGRAQDEVVVALNRLNNYLAHGTVPAKLQPHRKAVSQTDQGALI